MAPRWPGVLLPWAISRARASKMPVEKSSPSRTASENAVRRSAPLISSAIEISEFQITVSVMGSIRRLSPLDMAPSSVDLDHQMAKRIHAYDVAGQDDSRRFA